MTIPVILLNYNSAENTKKCVNSFKNSHYNHIFIIVDNASRDSEVLEKFFNYTLISNIEKIDNKNDEGYLIKLDKNYGYSYANNVGLQLAINLGFEYAIVANPDTEVIDIDCFDEVANKIDFVALFPQVVGINNEIQGLYYDKNWFQILMFNYFNIVYKIYDRIYKRILLKKSLKNDIITIDYSIGCFIFFNLKNFKKVGLFDDNVFLYGEEPIIYQKTRFIEKKVYYSCKLKVKHNHYYKSLTSFVKNEHHKSRVYYYKNYKKYPNWLISILEASSRFREETYEKIYSKFK